MKPARANEFIEPARALLHPLWLGSLVLLILNDHVLKGAGVLPGWLTGKLSDFAGLIVAPVVLAVLVRAHTQRGIALLHGVVGLGFAGLELSDSLTAAANWVYGLAGFHWHSTRDLTDLLALAVLPLAYLLTLRAGAQSEGHTGQQAVRLLATAGLLGCTASSGQPVPQQPACFEQDCDFDGFLPPEDCNDYDANLRPGFGCPALNAEDVCNDGIDNDFNGLTDCDDFACDLACEDIFGACAALGAVRIPFDQTPVLESSTLTGSSVTDGNCIGADSPEVIFNGSSAPGTLFFGVPAGHGVHVRSDCPDAYTELACTAGGEESVMLMVPTTGSDLTLVVEAIDPFQAGPFQVPVTFSPLDCGDGVRSGPEQCDDGNQQSGDGCSVGCLVELDTLCKDLPEITAGQTMGSFVGATTAFVGKCGGSFLLPEQGYRFIATGTVVKVVVDATADVLVHATEGCGDNAPPRDCANLVAGAGQETMTFTTQPGEELTFFVELADGASADATFTLDLSEL